MMIIKVTDDAEYAKKIKNAIQKNEGYCPCRIQKTPDTKCMCQEFRETQIPGYCHCGLYERVEV